MDLPIVCTLNPNTASTRSQGLLTRMAVCAEATEELSNGYRWRFAVSSEMLQTILATIDAERQCCRFLQFQLTVDPDGGPISLALTGPPGTREFLTALISKPPITPALP